MQLVVLKKQLWKRLRSRIVLPLVLCLLAFAAQAHTIELRAKLNNDGSATFYARTYHGMGELPSGGFIVDGVTYPFQGVITSDALPDGSIQISACNYSFSSRDNFQWVTVPNFNSCVAHTFNCTSNAPEAPLCNLTNTLTLGAPQITLQPAFANGVACVGSSGTLQVEASGNNVTYQWQINTGSGFVNVTDDAVYSGSTTGTLTISTVTDAMANHVFQCVLTATDNCGNPSSLNSNQVPLNPGYPVAITTQPADAEACFGTGASFSVSATGTNLTYQWQESTDGGANFTNLNGETSATLQLNNLSIAANGYKYRVVITGSCSVETSASATLTVADKAIITAQPENKIVCEGAATSLSATVTGLNLSYQWFVSTDAGTSFTKVNGATSSSLDLNNTIATMNGYQYRLVISGGCGADVTTNTVTVTVNSLPAVTAQPSPITICEGANASFAITATGTNLTYQWEESTDNGNTWTPLQGQTKATLNLSHAGFAMNGRLYRSLVSGACTPAVASNAALLTVNSLAAITSQPVSVVVCAGDVAHFAITTNNSGLSYQWQVSTNNGISWANIAGANSNTYSVASATAAMNGIVYRAMATGQCGVSAVSEGAVLTVNTPPTISGQPSDRSICAGANTEFSATASGTNLSYQWQFSRDNGATWTNIANATSGTLSISNATMAQNNNQYHVVITGSCSIAVTSTAAKLSVVKPVAAFTFQKNCENVPVTFTNQSTAVGTGPVKYTWNYGDGLSNMGMEATHTYANAGTYTVQLIATPVGCPFLSDTVEKTVVIEKAIAGQRLATVDAIANRNIQLQPRDYNASYKWYTATDAVISTAKAPQVKLQSEKTVYVDMTFASGCTTTDSVLVRVFKNDDVFVPSAFTPDGDGHNDYLKVIMVDVKKLNYFRVFDRWGNLVFETNDPARGWDGTYKGQKQRGETYLWNCQAVAQDGTIIKKSGNVTLIR
jgi:gliding motility-associated-like protein